MYCVTFKKIKILLLTLLFFYLLPLMTSAENYNDPLFYLQSYMQQIFLPDALMLIQDADKELVQTVVAVLDEGVAIDHPDLVGKIWVNGDEVDDNGIDDDHNGYIDDRNGYNFYFDNNSLLPFGDHGTMISGIIAATKNNYGIEGVNQKAVIMPITVCGPSDCDDEAITKGIRYAADNGAKIINLSLTGSGWDEEMNSKYKEAINYAFKKGCVVVAAAGNGFAVSGNGKNLNILKNSPVCDDSDMVLGVSSVDKSGIKSVFADYGSNCVDIVAPGENILSTSLPYYNDDASYFYFGDGTSFSAAVVSGVASLMKSFNPGLSNKEIIEIIKDRADEVDDINTYKFRGNLGSGAINIKRIMDHLIALRDREEVDIVKADKNEVKDLHYSATSSRVIDNIVVSDVVGLADTVATGQPLGSTIIFRIAEFLKRIIQQLWKNLEWFAF
jgi:subtilisin family serine protease